MPKFIGSDIPNAQLIHDNAEPTGDLVRITYAQAVLLPAAEVRKSLDTTDNGGPGTYAKRWYRWFAPRAIIADCPRATVSMLRRAGVIRTNFNTANMKVRKVVLAEIATYETRSAA